MLDEGLSKSTDINKAVRRREAGKVAWKNVVNSLLDSEKEDMSALRALRRKTNDPEILKLVCELLERKTERVIDLTQLLHYRDKEQEREE